MTGGRLRRGGVHDARGWVWYPYGIGLVVSVHIHIMGQALVISIA